MRKEFKVSGIGNAIVDTLAEVDESFLVKHNIQKGVMQLVDSKRSIDLLKNVKVVKRVAGGSAANTIVALSNLNIKTAYFGKVCNDDLGRIFVADLKHCNVFYDIDLEKNTKDISTGTCLVLITPDGERSMNTYLGATEFLKLNDINFGVLETTEWLYLEGYRFDGQDSQLAFNDSVKAVKNSGGKVALTLSDPFCVDRYRDDFRHLIRSGVDLVFCNESELISYVEKSSLNECLEVCSGLSTVFVCTAGPRGAFICHSGQVTHVPTEKLKALDVTGAGDFFAAGFLGGMINNADFSTSADYGNRAAAAIIQQFGCRLEGDFLSYMKPSSNL